MAEEDTQEEESNFKFAISLSVLNHLGRNLYRNFITVLGEAISNSWDADAKNVWINFDKEKSFFTIKDDGLGMGAKDFQTKFLKIGYSKRKNGKSETEKGRPFIGAKGIGKLALLSCAQRVTIFSKEQGADYVGGAIDNSGLDDAITHNLNPDEYPLGSPDFSLIENLVDDHDEGTILVFEDASEVLRTSERQIKKLIALSFHFSLIDREFTIHVNDDPISVDDLKGLAEKTQFIWNIGDYADDFLPLCTNNKEHVSAAETKLAVTGFLATVEKPSDLKIRGADSRATVDLFVNGRLRERNLLRHIPTQRIVESYVYGQIHFDSLDGDGDAPFTSSREGIVETDPNFEALIAYLKVDLIPQVIDEWDQFRLKHKQAGDDENPRKSKKERKATDLVAAAEEEFSEGSHDGESGDAGGGNGGDGSENTTGESGEPEPDKVDHWLAELRPDAEFNVSAYIDCFLAENLVRKYITDTQTALTDPAQTEADEWKDREATRKTEANISFDIRKDNDDLSYLGMDFLTIVAEGGKNVDGKPTPLYLDAVSFKPVRNAVGHTGLLTENAKLHLTVTFENMKARVRNILKDA